MANRVVVPALTLCLLLLAACGDADGPAGGGSDADGGGSAASADADCHQEGTTTDSGLGIEDTTCGDGEEAVSGATIKVHYVGTLENGEQFDSSRDRDQPFEFVLGAGHVIPGWDEGIEGMRVGGIRTLTIPPDLGYGAAGSPPVIPPNATLIFEVELLEVVGP